MRYAVSIRYHTALRHTLWQNPPLLPKIDVTRGGWRNAFRPSGLARVLVPIRWHVLLWHRALHLCNLCNNHPFGRHRLLCAVRSWCTSKHLVTDFTVGDIFDVPPICGTSPEVDDALVPSWTASAQVDLTGLVCTRKNLPHKASRRFSVAVPVNRNDLWVERLARYHRTK